MAIFLGVNDSSTAIIEKDIEENLSFGLNNYSVRFKGGLNNGCI